MNKFKVLYIKVVSVLNYVPRYGRTYRLLPDATLGPAEWSFRRHGYWGISLIPQQWFWDYIDETFTDEYEEVDYDDIPQTEEGQEPKV